jgi:DNA-binding transcriptional regulator YiaG
MNSVVLGWGRFGPFFTLRAGRGRQACSALRAWQDVHRSTGRRGPPVRTPPDASAGLPAGIRSPPAGTEHQDIGSVRRHLARPYCGQPECGRGCRPPVATSAATAPSLNNAQILKRAIAISDEQESGSFSGSFYQTQAMSNIVSGRQIRAARMLAGLTQADLARAAGCHSRSVRYWENKGNNPPTNVASTLDSIEQALNLHGVIAFSTPTTGVRLLEIEIALPLRGNLTEI